MSNNKELNQRGKAKTKATVERGRTDADVNPAMQGQPGLVAGSREEVAHSPGRPERVPMGNALKLVIPEHLKEEGFYYRFFQDRGGRIPQAESAYYQPVMNEQGDQYTVQSGPYLMRAMKLPMKYRDEDNALKKNRVQATLEAEAQIGQNEYAPGENGQAEGGTSALSHHVSDSPTG